MIDSIISYREPFNKLKEANFDEGEWEMLTKLRAVLQPFLHITNLLGAEKYATGSVLIPAIAVIECQMAITDQDPAYIVRFKRTVLEYLLQRIKD